MAQNRIDSIFKLNGFPPLVPHVPPLWPTTPSPNKLSLLWQSNFHELYHKYSPFTNYHDTLLSHVLSNKQPFVYKFIDEADKTTFNQLPATIKSLASAVNINQETIDDVVRVSKFLVSSWGVQFLAKQVLIQRLQPFDETRIFNPLSPILPTIRPFALGLGEPPMRHIEGGLLGLANSVTQTVGINLQSSYATPASTVGSQALPTLSVGQGKGLIRGGGAANALATFKSKWTPPTSTGGGILGQALSSFASSVGKSFSSFFGRAPSQTAMYRADEGAYDTMYNSKAAYTTGGIFNAWFMPWYFGNLNIGKKVMAFPSPQITFLNIAHTQGFFDTLESRSRLKIKGRPVGFTINKDDGHYMNVIHPVGDGELTNSEILLNFAHYVQPKNKYLSKFTDPTSDKVTKISDTLKSVINNINGNQTIYTAKLPTIYSKLISSGDPKSIGYDNLFGLIPIDDSTPTNTFGVAGEYNSGNNNLPPTLDKRVNPSNNLRFATTFTSDGMNQLGILSAKNGKIEIPWKASLSSQYPNWTEYRPYNDDLIAFFFYDVVNQKYIPFRATVKGISEGNTAFWDELRFIGRADQLYNYNGFSRTLSFSFNILINSISELLPCWKRIGYLASVVKPSNYTRSETVNNVFDRFMVPPMFMITIGDLYRYQPIVIRNININIPDDAIWETLNQDNSKEWTYLNGIIKNPSLNRNYGQFPREVEINVEGALLEKERAQVGGAHFGHAPRKDDWENFLNSDGELTEDAFVVGATGTEAANSYLRAPTTMNQSLITPLPSAKPNTQ